MESQYVPPFLNLAFQYIFTGTMKSTEFKVHCLEVVSNETRGRKVEYTNFDLILLCA
jgi:hypothetical protein